MNPHLEMDLPLMNAPEEKGGIEIPAESVATTKPSIDDIQRGVAAASYLKELCAYYPNDRVAPGLQSAWLPEKNIYYVSIHRFPAGTVGSRTVISKATADTLEQAERECMEIWRKLCKQVEEERRNAKSH